jgi:uncharacterized protein (DUF1330 family)
MKFYSIVEIDFTDRAWVPDYVAKVTAMIGRHGGRYLARTGNFQRVEGEREPPQLLVLIEWPSRDAALAFYASAEYAPSLAARQEGSRGQMYLVPGEDVARPGLDLDARS